MSSRQPGLHSEILSQKKEGRKGGREEGKERGEERKGRRMKENKRKLKKAKLSNNQECLSHSRQSVLLLSVCILQIRCNVRNITDVLFMWSLSLVLLAHGYRIKLNDT